MVSGINEPLVLVFFKFRNWQIFGFTLMIDFTSVLIFLKIFKIKNLWFFFYFTKTKKTNDFHERTQIFMEGYLINFLIL
jgi:hypothetical protein